MERLKKLLAGSLLLMFMFVFLSLPYFWLWPEYVDTALVFNTLTLILIGFFVSAGIIEMSKSSYYKIPRIFVDLSYFFFSLILILFFGGFSFLILTGLMKDWFIALCVLGFIVIAACVTIILCLCLDIIFRKRG